MYTIKEEVKNEIIINKSRFISILIPISDVNEIDNTLSRIKNTYKDATHYCYAYIIDNHKKASDDKEPSKTAGAPILNVLEKNSLNHILCVVVRYFGGIKLGSGGLIRSYSNSAKEVVNLANIIKIEKGYKISITFLYENIKTIDSLLKNEIIVYKDFNDFVTFIFKTKDLEIVNIIKPYINEIHILEEIIM